jgi:hypothetical protein
MAKRLRLLVLLGCVLFAALGASLDENHLLSWRALWTRLTHGGVEAQAVGKFKVALLDFANNVRITDSRPLLHHDPELEAWLQQELDAGAPSDDLEAFVTRIQQAWPRYMKVRVSSASGATLDFVRDSFHSYLQQVEPEMTHMACARRASVGGISNQVLLVTGQRLQDFTPDLLHRTQDEAFYNVCPLCKTSHISRAMRHQESSSLECPSCQRTYAVIAADTRGRFHYVNQYLTGYQPPAIYPKGQTRVEQLFTIWSAVHQNCAYTRDPGAKKARTDRWQTALETQSRGMGDCEDSSIFLADWLLSRGYEVRVALGKYGEIGGHAWCVVRLDGVEYLLESTSEGRPDFDQPPLVSRIGSRYVPEVLFDRHKLYVRKTIHQTWNGDYWTADNWLPIQPPGVAAPSITQSAGRRTAAAPQFSKDSPPPFQSVQRDFFNNSSLAYAHRTDRQAAPFLHLEQSGHQNGDDDNAWQFPAAIPGTPGSPEPEE